MILRRIPVLWVLQHIIANRFDYFLINIVLCFWLTSFKYIILRTSILTASSARVCYYSVLQAQVSWAYMVPFSLSISLREDDDRTGNRQRMQRHLLLDLGQLAHQQMGNLS